MEGDKEKETLIRRNLYHNFKLKDKLNCSLFAYFNEDGETSGFMDGFNGHDFTKERIERAQRRLPDATIHKIVWRHYEMGMPDEWKKDPEPYDIFYVKKRFRNKYGKSMNREEALPHLEERAHIFYMAAKKWNHINVTDTIPEKMTKTRLDSFTRTRRKSMRGYGCEALILTTEKQLDDGLDPGNFWVCKHAGVLDCIELSNKLLQEKKTIPVHESFGPIPSIKRLLKIKKRLPESLRESIWKKLKRQKRELRRYIVGNYSPVIQLKNGAIFKSTSFTVNSTKFCTNAYNDKTTAVELVFGKAEKDGEQIPFHYTVYDEFRFNSQEDKITDLISTLQEKTSFIDDEYSVTFKINDKECIVEEINDVTEGSFNFLIRIEGFDTLIEIDAKSFSKMRERVYGDHTAIFEEEVLEKGGIFRKYFGAFYKCVNNLNNKRTTDARQLTDLMEDFRNSLSNTISFKIIKGDNAHDDFGFELNGERGIFKSVWYEDYDYWNLHVNIKYKDHHINYVKKLQTL